MGSYYIDHSYMYTIQVLNILSGLFQIPDTYMFNCISLYTKFFQVGQTSRSRS